MGEHEAKGFWTKKDCEDAARLLAGMDERAKKPSGNCGPDLIQPTPSHGAVGEPGARRREVSRAPGSAVASLGGRGNANDNCLGKATRVPSGQTRGIVGQLSNARQAHILDDDAGPQITVDSRSRDFK